MYILPRRGGDSPICDLPGRPFFRAPAFGGILEEVKDVRGFLKKTRRGVEDFSGLKEISAIEFKRF